MMLEVIGGDPATGELFVMVGLGRRVQWYRNVTADGAVEVAVGDRRFQPVFRELAPAEAAAVLGEYERRSRLVAPIVRVMLSALVGWRYDGSPSARDRLVRDRPILACRPVTRTQTGVISNAARPAGCTGGGRRRPPDKKHVWRRKRGGVERRDSSASGWQLSQLAWLSRLMGANAMRGVVVKVFVAGATGALGKALVPQLVARGHEVVGMTRAASKQDLVRSLGARAVVADALDPDAVAEVIAGAEPEVIVHELTALSGPMSMRDARHPERAAAAIMTSRLRTEATDHLLAAGRAVGARRFVAQSFAAFRWARGGPVVLTEGDPIDRGAPVPPPEALEALIYLEQAVTTIDWGEGLALRYGGFYGPGTTISVTPDAEMAAAVRKRRLPIIGDGAGVFSHVHVYDAAAATVIAVEHGQPGIYNVVDDEPAPVREWLPVLAGALGAKPPRRIPRWLARLAAGKFATVMMTEGSGSSNEKAKCELGWELRYPSWREGFVQGLGSSGE